MAALLGPTNENGIVYTLVAADGSRAVFNDPADPNYIGPLSGDDGITGLDSADIIESYAQKTEDDGALHGNFYFGRRPITMTGAIVPTSALNRAQRIQKLKNVLRGAMRQDATLYFTPTGGELCYINVRAQQPPRIKGKFVKEFFVGLVAADPRAYGVKTSLALFEYSALSTVAWRRFTWSSGTGTALATRTVRIPPGTWRLRTWIKRSTTAGTLAAAITPNSSLVSTPANLTTSWTEMTQVVTTTAAEGSDTTIAFNLSSALTAGQWVELGPTVLENDAGLVVSATGAPLHGNFTAGAGYTASFVAASAPPGLENSGNAPAPPVVRTLGPHSNAFFVYAAPGMIQWYGTAYGAFDYSSTDVRARTNIKNGSTNDYSAVATSNTVWTGFGVGFALPLLNVVTGGTTGTKLDATWRNTYI